MADYTEAILTAVGRDSLNQMLDTQRSEISAVLDDLTDDEARTCLVPSLTTPLGLVKHATYVEKVWFHSRVDGRTRDKIGLPDTVNESFHLTDEDTIASVRAEFDEACARSRTIAAQHDDLEEQFPWRHGPVSLRFIYTHMIQEYARHAGHGDILVEQLHAAR